MSCANVSCTASTCPTAIFSRPREATIGVSAAPSASTAPGPRIARQSLAVAAVALALSSPAGAFSQITREDGERLQRDDIISAPLPPLDPDRNGSAPEWGRASVADEAPGGPEASEDDATARDAAPLPIRYGEENLPTPVRDLRARLMEIAASGEIEALRPYLETGARPTSLSVVPQEGDPIEFLKSASGDGDGVEILAILLEILEAGHVHVEAGTENEIYVWPYFTQMPLDSLTPPQLVELFEIVTAGDYANMLDLGAYYFYRVGISPDGRLEFFLAGD